MFRTRNVETNSVRAIIAAAVCGSLMAGQSFAQASGSTGSNVEKIEVTGSRIKKIDLEGASPVTVYSKEDIARSGQISVADFLRGSNSSTGMSSENATLSQVSGSSSFGGRDFGASYTLVLLNGRRLPTNAIAADFVDLNQIPIAAVERIEYMTDGASAIYGADAVAGVLNIITKKDFNGSSVSYQMGQSQDGQGFEQGYQIVTGSSTAKTNVLIAYDYFRRESIAAADRPLIKSAVSPDDIDSRSPTGIPGWVIREDGTSEAWSDCENPQPFGDGTTCYYDFAPLYQVQPRSERQSIFSFFDHEVNDDLTLFGEVRYSRTEVTTANGAAPGGVAISADTPNNPYGEDVILVRRYVDFGPRTKDNTNETFATLVGLKGTLGAHDWEFSMGRTYLRNLQVGAGGQINKDAASEAFKSGTLNPFIANTFDTEEKQKARDSIDTATFREGKTSLKTTDLIFSGPTPVELPGGELMYALGVSGRLEKFTDKSDAVSSANKILGGATSDGGGNRSAKSIFLEVNLPVISMLDLNLATRHDDLDTSGAKGTYKVSTALRPFKSLLVRTSYGTGFKAPDLHDLYLGQSRGVTPAIDRKLCNESKATGDQEKIDINCSSTEIQSRSSGNPDLKPEKSVSWNAGIVIAPVKSVTITTDIWNIEVKDQIGSLSTQELLNNESKYSQFVTRDSNGGFRGEGSFVESSLQNLTKAVSRGMDLGIRFSTKTGMGTFGTSVQFSKVMKSERQTSAVQPLCDLSKYSAPVDGKAGGSWAMGAYRASFNMDYWGSYKTIEGGLAEGTCDPNDPDSEFKVKANQQYHPQVGYTMPWGTQLTVGVNNVTNKAPAYDPYVSGGWPWYSQGRYRNAGRFVYAKLAQEF